MPANPIKNLHKDLLAFQTKMEQRFDRIDRRLDQVDRGLRGLRADMPNIVAKALREVLGSKSRKARRATPGS
jgi:hypothetical protein